MASATWTPRAATDLEAIVFYVADRESRPRTALQLSRDIVAKCEAYASNPELGTRRDDLLPGVRIMRHKRYVIIYRATKDGIEVLRVIDGARDFPALLGQ